MHVSVITVAHDCRRTLHSTIESVATQLRVNVEHIVVDVGSTDGSVELARVTLPAGSRLLTVPGYSYAQAVNAGIGVATGELVSVLPPVAAYVDHHVMASVCVAFADPSIEAVYGDLVAVAPDDPGLVLHKWSAGTFSRRRLRRGWIPPIPTLFVRRAVVERAGKFDSSYQVAAAFDAAIRWLDAADTVQYLPRPLVRQQASREPLMARCRRLVRAKREELRALRENDMGGLPTMLLGVLRRLPGYALRPR